MSQDDGDWTEVLHLIAEGSLPAALALRIDLPSITQIEQRARQDESFAFHYRSAKELQRHLYLDRILDIARAATRKTLARDKTRISALQRDVKMIRATEIPQNKNPGSASIAALRELKACAQYRRQVPDEIWTDYKRKVDEIVAEEEAARDTKRQVVSELGRTVCHHLAEGETLTAICRSQDMPDARDLRTMLWENSAFGTLYSEGRVRQGQALLERALAEAGEDHSAILRKDAYRWVSAELLADKPAALALEDIARRSERVRHLSRTMRKTRLMMEIVEAHVRDGKLVLREP